MSATSTHRNDRVFAKCAQRLIPFMILLYLLNFLDRVNVSFAALTMNKDLGFSFEVFGFGAGVLFVSYAFFQLPANMILDRVGARRWIFCILVAWGLISAANAFVTDARTFYLLRFLLGLAEAGFFPGMIYYLTLWFPASQRARYVGAFMTAQPLSFIVGAPLSTLILGMEGAAGLHGWQWLFLIEGLPASLLAFAVLRFLPDGPAQAEWLTDEEKRIIAARLTAEDSSERRTLLPALLDPRVWLLGLVAFGQNCGAYGVQLWLPQIVQAMGFSVRATGFIVALPFWAVMAGLVLCGLSSDMKGERVRHVAIPFFVAACGFVAASLVPSNIVVLAALTVSLVSIDAGMGVFWTLPSTFLSASAAAGGIALIRTISALGGLAGPYVVGVLRQASGDYSSAMAGLGAALVMSAALVLVIGRGMRVPKVQLS